MATTTAERTHAGPPGGPSEGSPTSHGQMSHREILEALSGLLLGMFVAMLSARRSSPTRCRDHRRPQRRQTAYTWVVTATLLTLTATTPIWGKLADLISKKLLVQVALVIFVAGSAVAGLSQNAGQLIASRAVQGVGVGGLTRWSRSIMAAMISPRERGRYSGYLGAVFAVGHGRRPADRRRHRRHLLARLALVLLRRRPVRGRRAGRAAEDPAPAGRHARRRHRLPGRHADRGRGLRAADLGLASPAHQFAWASWPTAAMVGGRRCSLLAVASWSSRGRAEPIIPLRLFRQPDHHPVHRSPASSSAWRCSAARSSSASTSRSARGESPTMAGLMTMPLIARPARLLDRLRPVITTTGRGSATWSPVGAASSSAFAAAGTIAHDTPYWHVAVFMALVGVGRRHDDAEPGPGGAEPGRPAATSARPARRWRSSAASAARSASPRSARCSPTGSRDYIADGLADLGPRYATLAQGTSGEIPDIAQDARAAADRAGECVRPRHRRHLPGRRRVQPLIALLFVVFIKEVPLKTKGGLAQAAEEAAGLDRPAAVAEAVAGVPDPARCRPRAGRQRDRAARLRPRLREHPDPARGGHADLAVRAPARPLGRPCRRLLRGGRAGVGDVRPDRLGRRLPAAGLHGGR